MPDPLKVECPHCGGSLKLKDRSADGKKVRCPKCQEVFKVELAEDDLEFDDLDDLTDDFGDEDELPQEEDEGPRRSKGSSKKSSKKKRKSSGAGFPWLIIAIAAVVVFALGGVVFIVANFSGGGGSNKIDLTYLPPDANMIVHLKVGELLGSPLISGALNQPAVQAMLNQQAQQTGVAAKDMVSVTVGSVVDEGTSAVKFPLGPRGLNRAAPATNSRTVSVLRTSVALKGDEIAASMKATPQTYGGKTYHKRNLTGFGMETGGDCIYLPEPNVAVMAMEADIKAVIDQGSKQARRREFDFINPNMTVLMAFSPKLPPNPAATIESPANQPTLQTLERTANKTFRAGALGVRISDRVDLEILVKCADGAGAGEMKTAADAIFAELKSQYEKSKNMLTLMGMNDVISLADKTVASMKADQSGDLVTAVASIPSEVKAVAENLSKNMPGMMMGMGGLGGPPGGGMPPGLAPPGGSGGFPATGITDPGQLPPGTLPGQFPPGTLPPGELPPGSLPPGTLPAAGAVPANP